MDKGLVVLAKSIAEAQGLVPELICAIIEQESAWNPWSIRYEPLFMTKYVAPLYTNNKIKGATEAYARCFSWGLMQVMGQVAREHGYIGPLCQLCDPNFGILVGCQVFKSKLDKANGDVTQALLLWNGGSNPEYAPNTLARVANYR